MGAFDAFIHTGSTMSLGGLSVFSGQLSHTDGVIASCPIQYCLGGDWHRILNPGLRPVAAIYGLVHDFFECFCRLLGLDRIGNQDDSPNSFIQTGPA